MARYNGDGDRRGRPRLRVSKSVRERKREHRGATRDISASGAAVVAEPGIEDRSSVDLDIEDVGDISGMSHAFSTTDSRSCLISTRTIRTACSTRFANCAKRSSWRRHEIGRPPRRLSPSEAGGITQFAPLSGR